MLALSIESYVAYLTDQEKLDIIKAYENSNKGAWYSGEVQKLKHHIAKCANMLKFPQSEFDTEVERMIGDKLILKVYESYFTNRYREQELLLEHEANQ